MQVFPEILVILIQELQVVRELLLAQEMQIS
jgi:hypothetical protein